MSTIIVAPVRLGLLGLALRVGLVGRREEALRAYDEALAVYTPLPEQYPAAYRPRLQTVLTNRARLTSSTPPVSPTSPSS